MGEATCAHCERWDPVTFAPIGPECGRAVVSVIRWADGRYSPACDQHGLNSLTPETRSLVAAVDPLPAPVATSPASPPAEWIAAVKSLTLEGTIYSMRLVGAPAATSPASPLPPTSPDGAGASCSPLASAAGAAFYDLRFGRRCRACGSPRLRQSDTSDHPGVVRCDACGLVQAS